MVAALRLSAESAFKGMLKPLVLAGFFELILWRLLSKLGPPVTSGGAYEAYSVLRSLASFTVSLAHIVAAVALTIGALWMFHMPGRLTRIIAPLLLALVQLSLLLPFLDIDQSLWFVYHGTFVAIVVALALRLALSGGFGTKLLAGGLVSAYLSSVYFKTAPLFTTLDSFSSFDAEVLALGEFLVIFNVPIFLWYTRESALRTAHSLKWVILSSIPAAVFLVSYLRSPWLTTALSMFSFGFSLYLPFPVYAVVLWLFTYILITSVLHKSGVVYPLSIFLIGGLMLQHPYLSLLPVLGLLLLSTHGTRYSIGEGSSVGK